jgi:hypothetical protein
LATKTTLQSAYQVSLGDQAHQSVSVKHRQSMQTALGQEWYQIA